MNSAYTSSANGGSPVSPANSSRWLWAIIGLGILLRLYDLAHQGLWYDEGVIVIFARYFDKPWRYFDPTWSIDTPIYSYFFSLWYFFVDSIPGVERGTYTDDYILRLLPAAISVITIPLVYSLARRLTRNTTAALLSALLFVVSPFQIFYAQELRVYSLHALINVAAALVLWRALESGKTRYWAAFTLTLIIGVYTHFFQIWVVVAFNIFFVLVFPWYWRRLGAWVTSNLLVILAVTPILPKPFNTRMIYEQAIYSAFEEPTVRTVFITFKNFFAGYSPGAMFYRPLTLLTLALVIIGLVALRKKPKAGIFLLVMGFVPSVLNVIYWHGEVFTYYTHRLMIFSAVPCYILVAQGVAALPGRSLKFATAGAVLALIAPALADYYQNQIHPMPAHTAGIRYDPETRPAAEFVRERLEPGDDIIHRCNFSLLPFQHYIDWDQSIVEFTPRLSRSTIGGYPDVRASERSGLYPEVLFNAYENPERLWFIRTFWEPFEPDWTSDALTQWFDGQALRVLRQPFYAITVFRYDAIASGTASVQRMTIADMGADSVPYYRFRDQFGHVQEAKKWRREFLQYLPTSRPKPAPYGLYFSTVMGDTANWGADQYGQEVQIDGVTHSVLAVDPETNRGFAASIPLTARDSFSYQYELHNTLDVLVTMHVRTEESVEVVRPMDFTVAEPESSVWTPQYEEHAPAEAHASRRIVWSATMTDNMQGTRTLYRDVAIPPGEYRMWARCLIQQHPENRAGLHARFELAQTTINGESGEPVRIGAVVPFDPEQPTRWRWVDIGSFTVDHERQRLSVTVENTDALERATFHLGRIQIVPRSGPTSTDAPWATAPAIVELSPGEVQVVEAETTVGGWPQKRIDIEAYDSERRTALNIAFYVDSDDITKRN